MQDYSKMVEALRSHLLSVPLSLLNEAADAIEALQAQLPKLGEIVRCGECAHCYAEGFAHERNICEKHPELGNVPDDWFCADGEREVQE